MEVPSNSGAEIAVLFHGDRVDLEQRLMHVKKRFSEATEALEPDVSVSYGTVAVDRNQDLEKLLNQADLLLYEAKTVVQGRQPKKTMSRVSNDANRGNSNQPDNHLTVHNGWLISDNILTGKGAK